MKDNLHLALIQQFVSGFPVGVCNAVQGFQPLVRVGSADSQGGGESVAHFRNAGDPAGKGPFVDR